MVGQVKGILRGFVKIIIWNSFSITRGDISYSFQTGRNDEDDAQEIKSEKGERSRFPEGRFLWFERKFNNKATIFFVLEVLVVIF